MHNITRSALVAHRAADMYALVNDIKAYPAFLPWCADAQVLSADAHQMRARIDIDFRGIRKSFATHNRLIESCESSESRDSNESRESHESREIIMSMLDGPFRHFEGVWQFTALDTRACRIALTLRFSLNNTLADKLFATVFTHIADTMVDSFVQRADELNRNESTRNTVQPHPAQPHLNIELVHSEAQSPIIESLTLPAPATIEHALRASTRLQGQTPAQLRALRVGVFAKQRPLDWQLADGDRVEIYRPLTMSPRELRRRKHLAARARPSSNAPAVARASAADKIDCKKLPNELDKITAKRQ